MSPVMETDVAAFWSFTNTEAPRALTDSAAEVPERESAPAEFTIRSAPSPVTEIPGDPETESAPDVESASIVCEPLCIQTPGAAPPESVTESDASPIGSGSVPVSPALHAGVRSEREETAAKTHRGWRKAVKEPFHHRSILSDNNE